MKIRRITSLTIAIVVFAIIPATSAFGAFIYDIGAPGFEFPSVSEFEFINGYTFEYTLENTSNAMDVEFTFTAPETWGSQYDPYKASTIFGTGGTTFNNVYGYFYKVTRTAGSINSIRIADIFVAVSVQ